MPRGANKKKFLVKKSGEAMDKKSLLKMIENVDPEAMARVEKILKTFADGSTVSVPNMADMEKSGEEANFEATEQPGEMDQRTQACLKAITRILSPFKGKIPSALVHKVVDASMGEPSEGDDMATKEASARMSPEKVSEDHKIEAMGVAKAAYKGHMEKLGYKKYPDAEIAQKADTDPDENGEDEEQEGTMGDVDKSDVFKSLDGEIAKLPKESRKVVTQIFKSHKDLIEKNESLSKEVDGLRRREQRREYVTKAEGMKHLGVDTNELADTLMDLATKSPEAYAKVEKILQSSEKLSAKSEVFKELGSNLGGNGKATWERIEAAAMDVVKKSGEKITAAAAVDRFLETSEGKAMYAEYLDGHPVNRR